MFTSTVLVVVHTMHDCVHTELDINAFCYITCVYLQGNIEFNEHGVRRAERLLVFQFRNDGLYTYMFTWTAQ